MSLYLKSATVQLLSLGGALFSGCLVYLILFHINSIENDKVNFFKRRSSFLSLEIIFLILLSMSLMAFYSSEKRTIFYFVLISLCSGILALLCIGAKREFNVIIQIVNIILLSLNIKLTKFYFFGGNGIDYWTHLEMNEMLSHLGNIEILIGKERYFPIMHINVAIAQIVPGLTGKDASMLAIIFPLVISSICVYFVGRELFSESTGLLGMLIVNISDYNNAWSFAPQTTSYGIIIFFFLIFVLFKLKYHDNKISFLIITFVFMSTMIMAHALSSFVLLITLIGLIIGSSIYIAVLSEKRKSFSPILLIIYVIGFIQYWFIAEYSNDGTSIFEQVSASLLKHITEYSGFLNRPEAFLDYEVLLPPLYIRLVDNLGLALLIFLAVIGSLYWLSSDFRSEETFSILFCTILLLGITFIFPLFGMRNIIPYRWFVFEYFFLGIMAAFAIMHIAKRVRKNKQISIIFVSLTCLSFFMITNTLNNEDNPLWLKDSTISVTYKLQEIKGAETITRYSDKVISDLLYWMSILGVHCGIQSNPLFSSDLSNRADDIFIWRKYMEDRPILMYKRIEGYSLPAQINVILGSKFKRELEKMHKIYENEEIVGYYIRPMK